MHQFCQMSFAWFIYLSFKMKCSKAKVLIIVQIILCCHIVFIVYNKGSFDTKRDHFGFDPTMI